jgi:hypothetical protein
MAYEKPELLMLGLAGLEVQTGDSHGNAGIDSTKGNHFGEAGTGDGFITSSSGAAYEADE